MELKNHREWSKIPVIVMTAMELSMADFPIVLQRESWEEIVSLLDRKLIFCMGDGADPLHLAQTPEDAVRCLSEILSPPQRERKAPLRTSPIGRSSLQ